ncbi:MAG: hypothetical protein LBB83_08065 [Treponema sp.]|jgi:hypothetical protein|nr:hypothetical protein [Treponema sp.]
MSDGIFQGQMNAAQECADETADKDHSRNSRHPPHSGGNPRRGDAPNINSAFGPRILMYGADHGTKFIAVSAAGSYGFYRTADTYAVISLCAFVFFALTRETRAHYPMTRKRSLLYTAAPALILFGLFVGPLCFLRVILRVIG